MKSEWKIPELIHYAAKTIDGHAGISWEAIAGELLVSFFLIAFAYMGYRAKILFLFYGCAIGAAVILLTLFYPLITNYLFNRKSRGSESE